MAIVFGALVFDGNSLTVGSHGTYPYPAQVIAALDAGGSLTTQNFAASGKTTLAMIARGPLVDACYRVRGDTVVAWEIINDLVLGTLDGADAGAHFISYCQARRAVGWRVIALTATPRSRPADDVERFETARQIANAMLRAAPSCYDALVDVGADDTVLGYAGAENDTTYYADKLHLNDTGYALVASWVTAAVRALPQPPSLNRWRRFSHPVV